MAQTIPSVNIGGNYGTGITPLAPGRAVGRRGGLMNPTTGAGVQGTDKLAASYFYPSNYHPIQLEVMYGESWAARKFINIPVDDMWVRGRNWGGPSETDVEKMQAEERRLRSRRQIRKAMKAARLFGSSMMVMMQKGALMEQPLDENSVRQGDLVALPVFHRYQCTIAARKSDPYSPDYGMPELYRVTPTIAKEAILAATRGTAMSAPYSISGISDPGEIIVHASRVLRFDGITPLTSEGWEGPYERDWGLSELAAVLEVIQQEITIAQATAQQVQEADIETIGIEGWRDIITGQTGPDEPTIEEIASQHAMEVSVFRTRYKDVTDTYDRSPINFAARPQLINSFHQRLAAAAGIPATRFLSQSPAGMNATGDSDMKNYAIMVKANQESQLTEPLEGQLDPVMARSAGLQKPPEYEWVPLMELSDQDMATVSKLKAEALGLVYDRSAITEDEMRDALDGDWLFGELGPMDTEEMQGLRELHGATNPDVQEATIEGQQAKTEQIKKQGSEPPKGER